MPLYEYRCAACAQTFDRRHGWDEPAGECPTCGGSRLERQLPKVAVLVKGARAAEAESCTPQGCARPGCPSVPAARMN